MSTEPLTLNVEFTDDEARALARRVSREIDEQTIRFWTLYQAVTDMAAAGEVSTGVQAALDALDAWFEVVDAVPA